MDAAYTFEFTNKWPDTATIFKTKLIVNYNLEFSHSYIDGLEMVADVSNFEVEVGGTVINDDMVLAETRGELLAFIQEQTNGMDLESFGITEDDAMQELKDQAESDDDIRYLMERIP